jgi:hypothetical protein
MEGLTAEQAAQQAQWGPDVGPPGPVSYIMNVIQSQQSKDDESTIIPAQQPDNTEPTTSGPDDSPSQQAPEENQQPTSTPTSDTVSSDSTTLPSSIETSTSILSASQETSSSSSTTSDIPSFTSDPATSTNDQPLFSLSIPTTSSISTSASAESTYVLSYEPIGGSISYSPTSTSSFVTSSSTTATSSRTPAADIGSHTEGSTESSDMISMSNSRKQAIVGGLAGAIGVLVILGLLLCFCLRRRQKRADDDEDEDEEEGLKKPVKKPMTLGTKASTVRLWNTLGRDTSRSTPEISRPKTAATIDGSLASEQWTHPTARKGVMRGSLEPAPLNVVNSNNGNVIPNSSRSGTPQQENEEQEGKPGFIRKQRSALATLLQDGPRTNSRNALRRGPISYPKPVAGDPVYSSKAKVEDSRLSTTTEGDENEGEAGEGEGETHSVGSLPSDTSSLMVVQQPPADPFFASTTMLSTMEEVAPPMQDSPSKQQQQQQELSRSVSHFGKNANPFRTQSVPSIALPPRIFSYSNPNFRASDAARVAALNNSNNNSNNNHARKSSMGSAYSRRQTAGTTILPSKRSSDQFDLMVSPDQMPPASGILAKTAEFEQRAEEKKQQQNQREETPADSSSPEGSSPNWYVYEGT